MDKFNVKKLATYKLNRDVRLEFRMDFADSKNPKGTTANSKIYINNSGESIPND
jgi:hypothetical protein